MTLQQQVERSGNSDLSVDALIVDLGKQKGKTTDMTLLLLLLLLPCKVGKYCRRVVFLYSAKQ